MPTVIIFHCIFPLLISLNYPILSSEISQKIFKKEFYILQCNYLWSISRQTSFENNEVNISNNVPIRHFLTTDYICGCAYWMGTMRSFWLSSENNYIFFTKKKPKSRHNTCNLQLECCEVLEYIALVFLAKSDWISLVSLLDFQYSKAISSWKLCCVT